MKEGKGRNSNQKLALIILLLFSICFLPGCDAYNKITGALSKYGYQWSVAKNPDGTGGINVNITPKENPKFLPDGNVTLQCSIPTYLGAKLPSTINEHLPGNPYISIKTGKGTSTSVGFPLVGVNPYLNHPGVNFETGVTVGTTGAGAYVQGGYISKGSNIGIIGTQSWGSGKPESSVSLQKKIGNGVASLNYYEGGGLGVGYKMPFN